MEQKIIEILKEHIEGLENAEVCEDTQPVSYTHLTLPTILRV